MNLLCCCVGVIIWRQVRCNYVSHVTEPALPDGRNVVAAKTQLFHHDPVRVVVRYVETVVLGWCGFKLPLKVTVVDRNVSIWYNEFVELATPANFDISQTDETTFYQLTNAEKHHTATNVSVYDDLGIITATKMVAYRSCQFIKSDYVDWHFPRAQEPTDLLNMVIGSVRSPSPRLVRPRTSKYACFMTCILVVALFGFLLGVKLMDSPTHNQIKVALGQH
jgi:hypothetical protein